MPRSYRQIAKLHGISLDQVKRLASQKDVDVYNDEEMKKAIDALQKRPGQVVELSEGIEARPDLNIDDIRSQIAAATKLDDIRVLKEKLQSILLCIKIDAEMDKLMPREEVVQQQMRIGVAVQAMMYKMVNEAAPKCSGKDEAGITEELEAMKVEMLASLANMESEFWETRKNDE